MVLTGCLHCKFYPSRTFFFGTRANFTRAVPKHFCSVNRALNRTGQGPVSRKSRELFGSEKPFVKNPRLLGVQGWRSGESTRLPPMWPGFDSQTRRLGVICRLSLLVLYSAPRGFPRVLRFPLSSKTNI